MADIKVFSDSKLIRVLADRVNNTCNDGDAIRESDEIITELASDMNPQNRHMIAQTMSYTLTELQKDELDFLNQVADQKQINYGDKAAFKIKNENGLKVVFQAKGATTPRSYVSERQVLVGTEEISCRPAINILDLRSGRINMADLIREANHQLTLAKLSKVEGALQAAIGSYASPFYGTGTGVNKTILDAQINYFRRLGPVNILGDIAAVSQLAPLVGMNMASAPTVQMQRSGNQLDEFNNNGFIGRYNGCGVLALENAYRDGETTPILNENWLYLIPGGMSADARNLKIVNEGGVNAFEAQDINDLVFEVRLDQWFGVAFVSGRAPTIGAYAIN